MLEYGLFASEEDAWTYLGEAEHPKDYKIVPLPVRNSGDTWKSIGLVENLPRANQR